jgi:tetratricopeptide (TPR) repeat protein
MNDKRLEGIALNNLGKLYLVDLKQPDKAIDYLLKGLAVRNEVGDKHEITKSYTQLSNYYFLSKNYPEAERMAQLTLKLGQEVGSLEAQRNGYEALYQVAEATGNCISNSVRLVTVFKFRGEAMKLQS